MQEANKMEARKKRDKGNEAFQRNCFEEAQVHYRSAFEYDQTDMTPLSNLAATHLKMEEYWECADVCLRAIEVGESNKADKELMGKTFYRLGNALEEVEDLLNSKTAYIRAYTLWKIPVIQNKVDTVKKKIDIAVQQGYTKSDAEIEKNMGNEKFQGGNLKEALDHYTKALRFQVGRQSVT